MSEGLEFGVQIIKYGDPKGAVKDIVLCDKAGFDHVSVPDHLFHPLDERFLSKPAWDAFVTLSASAVKTRRVKLSTGVSDPIRRHPATIAHAVATLDIISDGRARLGMGAGERFTFNPLLDIKFEKPATFLREALIVIKGLWKATKEEPMNFEGRFLKVKNGVLGLRPKQKYPPILVGGYGPRLLKITAELGDYWLPWVESPETYEKKFREIKKWARRYGREKEVKGALMTFSYIAESSEEAFETIARRVKVGVALRRRLLEEIGYKDYAQEVTDLWNNPFDSEAIQKVYTVADSLPDEVVEKVAVAGTVDDVISKIEGYRRIGVDLLIIVPPPDRIEETIERYRDVIRYFKEEDE
ncbi:LLM class flavin-dependent oxidoreductase [Candidatus Bathyarchaeota archaeon]|nr:LLM class flavin-dependent oxidoreductase [Candidatus Bathyarchaeota archaeon]